jgi:hypothetical protein
MRSLARTLSSPRRNIFAGFSVNCIKFLYLYDLFLFTSSQEHVHLKVCNLLCCKYILYYMGKKVNQSNNTPMEGQREREDIAPTVSRPRHWMG